VRRTVHAWQESGEKVGLVPTMGALHDGHRALIRRSLAACNRTVVSIFVNPAQFGPKDDFRQYPRPLKADLAVCRQMGVDAVFTPSASVVYPPGFDTSVRVGKLALQWEGKFRPGHFDGVATVVLKLFTAVSPNVAYFGQKDYQQFVVIRRMVTDFNLPLRLVMVPTVRESDGLALSSRNVYLNSLARKRATGIIEALRWAKEQIEAGRRQPAVLRARMKRLIERDGVFSLDYIGFCDPLDLRSKRTAASPLVILAAATCRARGAAHNRRFIDNLLVR
jgi:pantoate--beta-alanine ligase